jgi:hypothetical protein
MDQHQLLRIILLHFGEQIADALVLLGGADLSLADVETPLVDQRARGRIGLHPGGDRDDPRGQVPLLGLRLQPPPLGPAQLQLDLVPVELAEDHAAPPVGGRLEEGLLLGPDRRAGHDRDLVPQHLLRPLGERPGDGGGAVVVKLDDLDGGDLEVGEALVQPPLPGVGDGDPLLQPVGRPADLLAAQPQGAGAGEAAVGAQGEIDLGPPEALVVRRLGEGDRPRIAGVEEDRRGPLVAGPQVAEAEGAVGGIEIDRLAVQLDPREQGVEPVGVGELGIDGLAVAVRGPDQAGVDPHGVEHRLQEEGPLGAARLALGEDPGERGIGVGEDPDVDVVLDLVAHEAVDRPGLVARRAGAGDLARLLGHAAVPLAYVVVIPGEQLAGGLPALEQGHAPGGGPGGGEQEHLRREVAEGRAVRVVGDRGEVLHPGPGDVAAGALALLDLDAGEGPVPGLEGEVGRRPEDHLGVADRQLVREVPGLQIEDRVEPQVVLIVEDGPRLHGREGHGGGEGLVGARGLADELGVGGDRHDPAVRQHGAPLEAVEPPLVAEGDHHLAAVLAGLGEDLHPHLDAQQRRIAPAPRAVARQQEFPLAEQHHRRRVGLPRHRGERLLLGGDGREVGRRGAAETGERQDQGRQKDRR